MIEEGIREEDRTIEELVAAFDDLPILARLEFVSNVISNRVGDARVPSHDKSLATAGGVLDGAIRILRTVAAVDDLRGPV
jgi:hypothetical protein